MNVFIQRYIPLLLLPSNPCRNFSYCKVVSWTTF